MVGGVDWEACQPKLAFQASFAAEELLPTVEAVLRVFSETGNRKNKLKARTKFVLRDKGIEEFKRLVAESAS